MSITHHTSNCPTLLEFSCRTLSTDFLFHFLKESIVSFLDIQVIQEPTAVTNWMPFHSIDRNTGSVLMRLPMDFSLTYKNCMVLLFLIVFIFSALASDIQLVIENGMAS